MKKNINLRIGLAGTEPEAVLRALWAWGFQDKGLPGSVFFEDDLVEVTADWIDRWFPRCRTLLQAEWPCGSSLSFSPENMVKVCLVQPDLEVDTVLGLLETLPFQVASMAPLFPEWRAEDYQPPGFGDGHFQSGWACAFKGAGHMRLVSRRWLHHGPWRLLQAAGDTSLVLFHDPRADAATALAQARSAHRRMGIHPEGGFLQSRYVYSHELDGLYSAAERRLKMIVHGRRVSAAEMLDARAAIRDQGLGPDRPLDHVAYVFMEEGPARKHLHELWLHELECRALIQGREVRLDADYRPSPPPPPW